MNLIIALDALLRERSVTGAARRIGLSQPAMSHALTRLREILGDPLLVGVGRQITLTQRAEALTGRVTALVQELESLFGHQPALFNARETARTFRVAASECTQFVVLPRLQVLLSAEAPRASVHALPLWKVKIVQALRKGEIDLVLGDFQPEGLPPEVRTEQLTRDRLVGLACLDNPKAHGRLNFETYLTASHVVVATPGMRRDTVDDLLARRGLSRRVSMTVSSFLVAPFLVATSELFVTLPERIAQIFSHLLPVRRFDPPFPMNAPDTLMIWHERAHDEAAHQWLRYMVTEAVRRPLLPTRGRSV